MNRPITLATGQWGDLPLEELCELTGSLGFDGLEIAVSESVLSIEKAASSKEYCEERLEILHSHGLKMWAICAALAGQCVGDLYDPRLDNFAPARFAGKPEEIRKWAIDFMMQSPSPVKVHHRSRKLKTQIDRVCRQIGFLWLMPPV